ncbi:YceI family protein [Desulfurivibrio sp. C05AmB]|jgi:polyisoprenoid-binding protein YceI|uniref:YceI family protein n=1 Tax=Desulfurivibrio sp. C05AmB TaxID=3374371 RepID=UPI00376EF633
MKRNTILAALLVFLLFGAPLAQAETHRWEVDQDHSNIYFDVRHTFVTVRGLFENFSGTVIFDSADITIGRFDFSIEVASINTNINRRDDHLRSDDFFDTRKFPRMTFTTIAIKHLQGDDYLLEGYLTVKDVTRRVALPLTYYGQRENPLEKGELVAGFEIAFTMDRLAYNVGSGKFLEMGVVGQEVEVLVALEVLRDQ